MSTCTEHWILNLLHHSSESSIFYQLAQARPHNVLHFLVDTPLLKYVNIESCVEVMDHILSHYSHYHIQSTILLNFHEVQGVLQIARCIIHLWNVYAKFSDAQCVVDCTIMMKMLSGAVTLKYNTSKQGVYYTSYYCNHVHYQWTTFSWNVVKAHLNLCMFSLVRLQVGVAITNGHVTLKVWWVYPAVAPWRSLLEERPKLLQLIQGTQLIMTRLRYMRI